jgi:hypothetical protein
MSICPSCNNQFVQPFVCTTCGAEKLHNETMRVLEQQLADRIKREVMLRKHISSFGHHHTCNAAKHRLPCDCGYREALASTADLDGLILCEKEPVAWQSYHSRAMPELSVEFDEPELVMSFNDDVVWKKPLYRAWEPK